MPNKTLELRFESGKTDLRGYLFAEDNDLQINTGVPGYDVAVEYTNRKGLYSITVAEVVVAGWHTLHIYDGQDERWAGVWDAKLDEISGLYKLVPTPTVLAASGIDRILVESGLTPGPELTNDTGTQLTSINLRQVAALIASALGGVISGVIASLPIFKQAGKPAGVTRIAAATTADGRTSVTLKVPD